MPEFKIGEQARLISAAPVEPKHYGRQVTVQSALVSFFAHADCSTSCALQKTRIGLTQAIMGSTLPWLQVDGYVVQLAGGASLGGCRWVPHFALEKLIDKGDWKDIEKTTGWKPSIENKEPEHASRRKKESITG